MEQALKNLMARVISIKNDESFLLMGWLSSAKYVHGSGYVELAFDPNLKPYLLQLKNHYTQYKFDRAIHFKSIYAIRLYELLKKEAFKAKNGNFSVFFEYEELREYFGVEHREYVLFAHFRTKAIEPARSEISNKTDLYINDVQYGKTGRKITNMTFFVTVRENETNLQQANLLTDGIRPEKESDNNHPVIDSLVSLGFSLEIAKKYKDEHGENKIERNIAYTLAKNKEREISDIPSYLNKAIKYDYGNAWEKKRKKDAEEKQQSVAAEKSKTDDDAKKRKESKEKQEKVLASFYGLSQDVQDDIKKDFLVSKQTNQCERNVWVKTERANQNPIEQPQIKFKFVQFLIEQNLVWG
jgi:plasmid replication initiation protein